MSLNKKTVGIGIFIILGLLLFFSRTLYTYNLPEVTGTKPSRGSLSKLEISSGIAVWAETENIYAAASGAAGRVFVKEGEAVIKGQALFEMDFDLAAAERRLAEIKNNTGKLETDIQRSRQRLNTLREALNAAAVDETELPAETGLSGQAGLIALEIERARFALKDAELGFELGGRSRGDVINAENNLKSIFYKYEAELEELEFSLVQKSLDLKNLGLAAEASEEILRDYRDNAVIRAPLEGIIHVLNAERGKYFMENALLASIGVGGEFIVECFLSADNNFVNAGDSCELSNASRILTGTVGMVKPSAQGKIVSVLVKAGDIKAGGITAGGINAGESFDLSFEKKSASSFTLVPNGSLNQDSDGYFLYQIKRCKGILGEEYYLDRLNVFTGDSDRQHTAIIRGITFFDPIVLLSDRALEPGITVSLKNPEDFFEN